MSAGATMQTEYREGKEAASKWVVCVTGEGEKWFVIWVKKQVSPDFSELKIYLSSWLPIGNFKSAWK